MVFKPPRHPTKRLDPRNSGNSGNGGHLVEPEGSPARAPCGATGGSNRVPGAKKSFFPKLFLDYLGCSNKCFWLVLSPWCHVLADGKSQNALKMGPFGTKKRSKMGQKRIFPKVIHAPFAFNRMVLWDYITSVLYNCVQHVVMLSRGLDGTKQKTSCSHMGAGPSRGWVAGRLWNPPPPPWLAGWLARPRKTAKIHSAPLYRLFSRMVWVWVWVCKGGGVGHLSRIPLPHTPSCLAFGTSHKDQKYKT